MELEEKALLIAKFYAKRFNMTLNEFLSKVIYMYEDAQTDSQLWLDKYDKHRSELYTTNQDKKALHDLGIEYAKHDIELYRKYLGDL